MPRFRKKPVEVDAIRFDADNYEAVRAFVGDRFVRSTVQNHGVKTFLIRTLEGNMAATRGDWIIRGVKGEIYPVKPDIFGATYEPAQYIC